MSRLTDTLQEKVAQLHTATKSSSATRAGRRKSSAIGPAPGCGRQSDGRDEVRAGFVRQEFLFAKVLRARTRTRKSRVDTREAKKLPGVVAVLAHQDVAGTNLHGLIRRDQEVLCSGKSGTGDAIAVVVAKTEEIAIEALTKNPGGLQTVAVRAHHGRCAQARCAKDPCEGNVLGEKTPSQRRRAGGHARCRRRRRGHDPDADG